MWLRKKIRNKVENHIFLHEGKIPLKITVSGGLASIEAGRTFETADEFIKSADKKLYRAKRGGRNQVVK